MCRRSKIPEIKCSGDQMCQSYLEIKCAGDQKFRRSNVPEITCSGDQMFRRLKIPEIKYSGNQMCQVLMEIINSRRSSVFGDQVCVSRPYWPNRQLRPCYMNLLRSTLVSRINQQTGINEQGGDFSEI